MLQVALEKNGPVLYSASDVHCRPTHTENNRNFLCGFVDKIFVWQTTIFRVAFIICLSCKNVTGKFYGKEVMKAQKESRGIALLFP